MKRNVVSLELDRRLEKHLRITGYQLTSPLQFSVPSAIYSAFTAARNWDYMRPVNLCHFLFILGVEKNEFSHKGSSKCTLLKEKEKLHRILLS